MEIFVSMLTLTAYAWDNRRHRELDVGGGSGGTGHENHWPIGSPF